MSKGETIVLDDFQEQAINYAKNNCSVVVSAPTGAGKTLIAEYIIQDCLQKGKEVVYTAPIKALSNQKFRDFSKKYPKSVGIITGDVSINRRAGILIMTTEIFRNLILIEPEELKKKEWIIFDEIHYLDDIERGTVWEETIILLPRHMKFLALSATISNIRVFTHWLEKIHSFPVKCVVEKERPVPLHFFFQMDNAFFSDLKEVRKNIKEQYFFRKTNFASSYKNKERNISYKPNRLNTLIEYLCSRNILPCIYFSFSRLRCEKLASEVGDYNFLTPRESKDAVDFFNNLAKKFAITSYHTEYLLSLIRRGIAYHHAGLLPSLKEIIEQLFTHFLIKMIFTTETFALGINMPAKGVVFDSIIKNYGYCRRYLRRRDFSQMAGRAGRRGIDKEGYVIIRLDSQKTDIEMVEDIIYGEYEPIRSQFNSSYATLLNLYRLWKTKLYDIYPYSFHFYERKYWQQKEALSLLKRKIHLLKELNYIQGDELTLKGELARVVYGFELPLGEMFSQNILEELSPKMLFVILAALVYEPRKGERKPHFRKNLKVWQRRLSRISKDIHQKERYLRIYPLSKRFFFHISEAALHWYEGESFSKILRYSNTDEGSVVRYFRMCVQVLRELSSSVIPASSLRRKASECLKVVNRDVVDAEAQLSKQIE